MGDIVSSGIADTHNTTSTSWTSGHRLRRLPAILHNGTPPFSRIENRNKVGLTQLAAWIARLRLYASSIVSTTPGRLCRLSLVTPVLSVLVDPISKINCTSEHLPRHGPQSLKS